LISGVIPFNLEYLKELVVLDLSFNKLTGTIPSSVGEVSNLVILQLYMNRLSGELPTNWKLKTFRNLSRFNNELEGEIPSSLYQVGVKTLLLSSNNFMED
jgi:hypothetical protein